MSSFIFALRVQFYNKEINKIRQQCESVASKPATKMSAWQSIALCSILEVRKTTKSKIRSQSDSDDKSDWKCVTDRRDSGWQSRLRRVTTASAITKETTKPLCQQWKCTKPVSVSVLHTPWKQSSKKFLVFLFKYFPFTNRATEGFTYYFEWLYPGVVVNKKYLGAFGGNAPLLPLYRGAEYSKVFEGCPLPAD